MQTHKELGSTHLLLFLSFKERWALEDASTVQHSS